MSDPVKEPPHYQILVNNTPLEAWDISDALFYNNALLWNVLKYLIRVGSGGKSDDLQDLKKARQYLDREIARRESLTDLDRTGFL